LIIVNSELDRYSTSMLKINASADASTVVDKYGAHHRECISSHSYYKDPLTDGW